VAGGSPVPEGRLGLCVVCVPTAGSVPVYCCVSCPVDVGEGRDIELRHQRNPDVVFDYVRAVQGESFLSWRAFTWVCLYFVVCALWGLAC
jgi:hypothetical protein